MSGSAPTNRALKEEVRQWLTLGPVEQLPKGLFRLPARRLINPLLSFLCSRDVLLKWRSVTAIGQVVAALAETEIESARVIMRRLMWSLNDESGGIGWGAPETLGEIMACHRRLADEFHLILISYLDPDGNFLEYESLQPGVLWGLGRLARSRKDLAIKAEGLLPPYLASAQNDIRGHAAWSASALGSDTLQPVLNWLMADKEVFWLYWNQRLQQIAIGEVFNNQFRR